MDATPSDPARIIASSMLVTGVDPERDVRVRFTAPRKGDSDRIVGHFTGESTEGWSFSGSLSRTWRGLAISTLTVEPWIEVDNEPGHITSTILRQIPTGFILAAAQSAGLVVPDTNALVEPPKDKPQPGRQPLSDDLLREVAEQYLAETAPGKPRGANTRLAEHFGKPTATISRWVMRARADGWLGPAVPGREGGEPGPRLARIIPNRPRYPSGEPRQPTAE